MQLMQGIGAYACLLNRKSMVITGHGRTEAWIRQVEANFTKNEQKRNVRHKGKHIEWVHIYEQTKKEGNT